MKSESLTLGVSDADLTDERLYNLVQELEQYEPTGLSLRGCQQITPQGIRHLVSLPTLRTVHLGGTAFSDDWLPWLAALPNLTCLRVPDTEFQGTTLRDVHLNLEVLDASNNRLNREAFEAIGELTHLRELALCFMKPPAGSLEALGKLEGLESLDLTGCSLEVSGLPRIDGHPKLRYLSLAQTRFNGKMLPSFSEHRSLGSLRFEGSSYADDQADIFRFVPALESVNVSDTGAGRLTAGALSGCSRLRFGSFWRTPIGDQEVSQLSRLPLEQCYLGSTAISDDAIAELEGMLTLTKLFLNRTNVTGRCLHHIGTMVGLEVLSLWHTAVDDSEIGHLAKLRKLRTLYLGFTDVTDQAVPTLANLPALQNLNLYGTDITNASVEHLVRIPSLSLLGIEETAIDAEGEQLIVSRRPDVKLDRHLLSKVHDK